MDVVNGQRVRVAIADDSEEIRALLKLALQLDDRLELAGEAGDGREALALVGAEQPDVLLLDVGMPRLDGLQVLDELQALHPGVKVVVYSGFAGENVREAALAAGAEDYLVKGIDPKALAERLAALRR